MKYFFVLLWLLVSSAEANANQRKGMMMRMNHNGQGKGNGKGGMMMMQGMNQDSSRPMFPKSKTAKGAGPQTVRVDSFYMAYVVPDLTREPTRREYQALLDATTEYFNTYFQQYYANNPNVHFLSVEPKIRYTMYDAGFPEERFNVFIEFSSADFHFSSDSKVPSPNRLFNIMKGSMTPEFILEYVREVTPFESTVEVLFGDSGSTFSPFPSTPYPTPVGTSTPVPIDTPAPAPTRPPNPCNPTTGPCVSTIANLNQVLSTATTGSVVALCGNRTALTTSSAVQINTDQTTLCCASRGCIMRSQGTNPNLIVNAASVTIQDIEFLNGKSGDVGGGNVRVVGGGNHRIIDSTFRNGQSNKLGGNLYVETDGNLEIRGSSFIDGRVVNGTGGGLSVNYATSISIANSNFIGNEALDGGGFYSLGEDSIFQRGDGQVIVIRNSAFKANSAARLGGGFVVSALGDIPSLEILNTEFSQNTAVSAAAAGAIVEFLTDMDLVLSNNFGTGNVDSSNLCDGFGTAESSTQPVCLSVDENYP
jgi:hypothetical protein